MTLHVDLFYTMRSPYCYLSTPRLAELCGGYDLHFALRPVYPLAVSDPSFFETVNPLFPPYLMKDTRRVAERLGIPYRWPRPDPIVQDMATRKVAAEQPYIRHLTHLAQAAAERNRGLEFVVAVSATLFNPEIEGWDEGDHLATAIARAGLDVDELESACRSEGERLEAAVRANREAQLAAGHWGAPLFVFEGEVFFGQDRIEDLVWYLERHGLRRRSG